MKLNMKTLCSVGALLLCSESALAMEANYLEKRNNGTQNSAPMSWKSLDLSTDPLSVSEEELPSITGLCIRGCGTINHSQLETLSSILAGAKNLKCLELRNLGLKEIPKEVFNLKDLTELFLSSNNLTHIPNAIEQLTKLSWLIVNCNENLIISSELNNLINLRHTSESGHGIVVGGSYRGDRVLDLSNKNLTQIPFDITYVDAYSDSLKKLDLQNNKLKPESFPNFMIQLRGIEVIDLRNNPSIDSIDKLPASVFGMPSLKKILLTGTTHDIEYNSKEISSIRKKKIEELNSKIASIDNLINSAEFINMREQLNVKKEICESLLDKLEQIEKALRKEAINDTKGSTAKTFDDAVQVLREGTTDDTKEPAAKTIDSAEIEAAKTASQAVVSQSSYFKFGQFFKSMWPKFTESKLGQMLNFVKSYFFQN